MAKSYVCRTCLYVGDNEFLFKKVEKVRPLLVLFVPEIKNNVTKISLICEQCYYFLKNVEKFKLKCLETQKKLYHMNLESITDSHNAALQNSLTELPSCEITCPDSRPEVFQVVSPKKSAPVAPCAPIKRSISGCLAGEKRAAQHLKRVENKRQKNISNLDKIISSEDSESHVQKTPSNLNADDFNITLPELLKTSSSISESEKSRTTSVITLANSSTSGNPYNSTEIVYSNKTDKSSQRDEKGSSGPPTRSAKITILMNESISVGRQYMGPPKDLPNNNSVPAYEQTLHERQNVGMRSCNSNNLRPANELSILKSRIMVDHPHSQPTHSINRPLPVDKQNIRALPVSTQPSLLPTHEHILADGQNISLRNQINNGHQVLGNKHVIKHLRGPPNNVQNQILIKDRKVNVPSQERTFSGLLQERQFSGPPQEGQFNTSASEGQFSSRPQEKQFTGPPQEFSNVSIPVNQSFVRNRFRHTVEPPRIPENISHTTSRTVLNNNNCRNANTQHITAPVGPPPPYYAKQNALVPVNHPCSTNKIVGRHIVESTSLLPSNYSCEVSGCNINKHTNVPINYVPTGHQTAVNGSINRHNNNESVPRNYISTDHQSVVNRCTDGPNNTSLSNSVPTDPVPFPDKFSIRQNDTTLNSVPVKNTPITDRFSNTQHVRPVDNLTKRRRLDVRSSNNTLNGEANKYFDVLDSSIDHRSFREFAVKNTKEKDVPCKRNKSLDPPDSANIIGKEDLILNYEEKVETLNSLIAASLFNDNTVLDVSDIGTNRKNIENSKNSNRNEIRNKNTKNNAKNNTYNGSKNNRSTVSVNQFGTDEKRSGNTENVCENDEATVHNTNEIGGNDNDTKKSEQEGESDSDDALEVVEINSDDDNDSASENAGRVEIKIANTQKTKKRLTENSRSKDVAQQVKDKNAVINNKDDDSELSTDSNVSVISEIKQEILEPDEETNPGFFNKQCSDGFYKCRLCQKKYKTSKGLYNHTREKHAHEIKIFHCQYCSFFTLWRSSIARHLNVFHAKKPKKKKFTSATTNKCTSCPYKSRSEEQLIKHIKNKHWSEKECTVCKEKFNDSLEFARHVEKAHFVPDNNFTGNLEENPETLLKCDYCSCETSSPEDMFSHVLEDHVDKLHSCNICKIRFIEEEELEKHKKTQHSNNADQEGEDDEVYIISDEVTDEINNKNANNSQDETTMYKCPNCSLVAPSKDELRKHILTEYFDGV